MILDVCCYILLAFEKWNSCGDVSLGDSIRGIWYEEWL